MNTDKPKPTHHSAKDLLALPGGGKGYELVGGQLVGKNGGGLASSTESEPALRRLPVDLETIVELATESYDVIDSCHERTCYVDTQTGEVHIIYRRAMGCANGELEIDELEDWEADGVEVAEKIWDDQVNRFVEVERWHSSESFDFMEEFALAVGNSRIRGRLLQVLQGRKPFRNFKDALFEWPELRETWFRYLNHRQREKARDWLRNLGIEAEDVSLYQPGPVPKSW